MKHKKSVITSILIGVVLLTGCANDNSLVNGKETSMTDVTEEAPMTKYHVIGNDKVGYLEIPTTLERKSSETSKGNDVLTYGNADNSFVLNLMTMGKDSKLETAKERLEDSLKQKGVMPSSTGMILDGNDAYQVYSYYEKEQLHLFAYIVETSVGLSYFSIEFTGDFEHIRDFIMQSFREQK